MASGLTAEQVLGEYWKDPLFGLAAADHTINMEVLHKRIWPNEVAAPVNQTIRFVIANKTDEPHLLAFSLAPEDLLADKAFQAFVQDELYHAEQKAQQSAGHHHHGGGGSVEETQDIVKTLEQKPSVFVMGHEEKEILIQFSESEEVLVFCAMDDHLHDGYLSILKIETDNN